METKVARGPRVNVKKQVVDGINIKTNFGIELHASGVNPKRPIDKITNITIARFLILR